MANYTEKDPITAEPIWFIIQIVCREMWISKHGIIGA